VNNLACRTSTQRNFDLLGNVDIELLQHLGTQPSGAAIPELSQPLRGALLPRARVKVVYVDRTLESTKTLSVMEGLAACSHCSTKPEGRIQLRHSLGFCLLIGGLPRDHLLQFIGEHGADAGSALSGKGSCLFQEALVECECDVLLHDASSSRLHVTCVER
jgi:hypothetical protein